MIRAVAGIAVIAVLGLLAAALTARPASADDSSSTGPIRVTSAEAVSEFPAGIRFTLRAESESPILSAAVRFRATGQVAGVFAHLEHGGGGEVEAELFWRTDTTSRYIPPGALLRVMFEVEDAAGNFHETPAIDFVYHDARFAWEEISEGPVTLAYHGPVQKRAQSILDSIVQTMVYMGPLLGADTSIPIRVTVYNNNREMFSSLPLVSQIMGQELVTEGQAFPGFNTLLMLGSGLRAVGTAGHEVVHILTHRAGDSAFRRIPSWLDEGLAEFGNPDPGYSYDIALDYAIEAGELLPVVYMLGMPGNSEQVIIFYGQSRSIVRYMIVTYGPVRMRELMAELKGGARIDVALRSVYGFDREELDRRWRAFLGAPEYTVPERARARPTAIPLPTLEMYTNRPQPVGSQPAAAPPPSEPAGEAAASEPAEDDGGVSRSSPIVPLSLALVGGVFGPALVNLAVRRIRQRG